MVCLTGNDHISPCHRLTGITCVPPLALPWPKVTGNSSSRVTLRHFLLLFYFIRLCSFLVERKHAMLQGLECFSFFIILFSLVCEVKRLSYVTEHKIMYLAWLICPQSCWMALQNTAGNTRAKRACLSANVCVSFMKP